ncbi:MAG: ribosome recycling factor [Spirochaetes bacterium GWF1_51_8]|nr:MAG: ribosome recycling factor [Spirochaetes bacterium GWF1_51_8]
MLDEFKALKKEANEKMDKTIQHLKDEYKKLRTGRANVAMVEDIKFLFYGNPTPVKQAASLQTPDPHTILIDPWDKSVLHAIDKGISDSGLGFTASNDGRVIRVSIPPLTEDRKKEMVKYGKEMAEESRVVVRNWRRDINAKVKQLLKDGHIGEDDERKELDDIQKVTDNHIKTIDDLVVNKEKEIMEV